MNINIGKIGKFSVTYINKEEFKILQKEIFQKEIYSIDLKKKNPYIIDLGAHIGLATLYFKMKYPQSKILCFEPNPNVTHILEENIFINNLDNVRIEKVALGKREEKRKLYIDSSGYSAFSTSSFKKDAWNSKQKSKPILVDVKKLSSYIDRDVDLIKIDVEGNEKEIIDDLNENNSFKKIQNIIMEYHPINRNGFKYICSILRKNNYELENSEDEEGLILVIAKKSTK